jgi:hypothetical protein
MQMGHRLGSSRLQCGAGRISIFRHRPSSCTGQHQTPTIKYATSTIQHSLSNILRHSSWSTHHHPASKSKAHPPPPRLGLGFTADAPRQMHREVLSTCRTALCATVPMHDHHDGRSRVAECSRVRAEFGFQRVWCAPSGTNAPSCILPPFSQVGSPSPSAHRAIKLTCTHAQGTRWLVLTSTLLVGTRMGPVSNTHDLCQTPTPIAAREHS